MTIKTEDYPLAKELILDRDGTIGQVVLDFNDYRTLIEMLEDEMLYRLIVEVREETPLNREQAIAELEAE